ncbi:MAG: hypothetical protein ABI175_06730 [Polyangiales bacterium]
MRARHLLRSVVCALACLGATASCGACKGSPKDDAPEAATVATASASIKPSASIVTGASSHMPMPMGDAAPPLPVACAVAYATYPAGDGPKPGDDLSDVKGPVRVPAGASLTIAVRKSGHELTFEGPVVFRPCTRPEPDVVLLVSGHARNEGAVTIRPGTELFIATPSGVAIVGRAGLLLSVSASSTSWELTDGEATFTNLDTTTPLAPGKKGTAKRFSDGGLLLTRCGVQAASVANTERLLLGGPDGGAPLPAASVGILTAESIKHAREKVLDCSFAEAFGLSCDLVTAEGSPKDKAGGSGCKGGYDSVLAYVAKVSAPGALPPGTPAPP